MNSMENAPFIVSQASETDRATFYRRTYAHVAGAFAGFAALLYAFFASGIAQSIMAGLMKLTQAAGAFSWLIVLAVFWGGTYVAQKMAANRASRPSQYLGLGLYVLLQALIFVPLIAIVAYKTHGDIAQILLPACAVTGALVLGLSVAVFFTGVNFSFLRIVVVVGSICALGAILVFSLMGINPGTWFALAMILLMSTVILYQTWVIKDECSTEDYVLASLILFSAFVTLLWYVIQFFLGRRSE
jgi:FtsH-binding integral membrane protein